MERERKGKGKQKGKLEVRLWQKGLLKIQLYKHRQIDIYQPGQRPCTPAGDSEDSHSHWSAHQSDRSNACTIPRQDQTAPTRSACELRLAPGRMINNNADAYRILFFRDRNLRQKKCWHHPQISTDSSATKCGSFLQGKRPSKTSSLKEITNWNCPSWKRVHIISNSDGINVWMWTESNWTDVRFVSCSSRSQHSQTVSKVALTYICMQAPKTILMTKWPGPMQAQSRTFWSATYKPCQDIM